MSATPQPCGCCGSLPAPPDPAGSSKGSALITKASGRQWPRLLHAMGPPRLPSLSPFPGGPGQPSLRYPHHHPPGTNPRRRAFVLASPSQRGPCLLGVSRVCGFHSEASPDRLPALPVLPWSPHELWMCLSPHCTISSQVKTGLLFVNFCFHREPPVYE